MSAITRRSFLAALGFGGAAAAGGAVGLLRPVGHRVAMPPPPPPVALVSALDNSKRLDVAYTAAITRAPADASVVTTLRRDVREHADALSALLERYPGWRYERSLSTAAPADTPTASPYPSPSAGAPIAGSGDALRAALAAIIAASRTACLEWPADEAHASEAVGLLGAISATLATHLKVLS